MWVSPTNSPVKLGVSPAAISTLTGVFTQWFEALFPCAGTLGRSVCCRVCQLLPCPPCSTIHLLAGSPAAILPTLVLQPLPCWESSPPGCLSPPLLCVSMIVSSLTLCFSDFQTVRFSVSSGCFLFLNCCCLSFGCARRHSVSTYTSILAGSLCFTLTALSCIVCQIRLLY